MSATAQNHENGAPSAVESKGNAGIESATKPDVFCAHRGHGCISQNGYLCLNGEKCVPVDGNGRRFVVFDWIEDGQPLATRHYLDDANGIPLKQGNKAVCGTTGGKCMCQPENHTGKGACGKAIVPIIVGS